MENKEDSIFYKNYDKVFSSAFSKVLKELSAQILQVSVFIL